MKKNFILSKTFARYLKDKKAIYIYFGLAFISTFLSFIPMFVSESYNYSWMVIAINALLLMLLLLFIFNTLFIDSNYNQLDLLLLSKAKSAKQVYLVKWIISLFVMNIFIIFNSFVIALIFSIYSSNGAWFIPILFSSFFGQNLIVIILILLFSLFSLMVKNKVMLMVVSVGVVTTIFAVSIPLKVLSDQHSISSSELKYNQNKHHIYATLYFKDKGQYKSKIIEKTNYKYLVDNNSLQEGVSNIDAYNPLNWINSMTISAISKQISNQDIILNSHFNINNNNFSISSNFYNDKPHYNDALIYPNDVKPLFMMDHKKIKKMYADLYKNILKKGYTEDSFLLVKNFVEQNDFWQNPDIAYQEVLFNSIGLTDEEKFMYFLRDKKLLFKKVPDILSWIQENTSKKFASMISGIYKSPKSMFNINNITLENRNQLIPSQRLDVDKKPHSDDIKNFKEEFVQINNTQVKIDGRAMSLVQFNNAFPNIHNQAQWKEYIDKNSFTLKQLQGVLSQLKQTNQHTNYLFARNDSKLNEFHYAYNNQTTTPSLMVGVTITVFILLIIALGFANNKKLKKANMKGF